jgi:hypothetical protein
MGISYKFPYKESLYSEIPAVLAIVVKSMGDRDGQKQGHKTQVEQNNKYIVSQRTITRTHGGPRWI